MESSASQPRSHALSYESHTLPLAAVRITTCTVMMHLRLCSSTRPGWTPAPRPPTPCPGPHPSARPTPSGWPDAARCHACVHHAHAHSTMQPGSLPLTTVAPKHPQAPRLCRIPSSFESALKLASIQQVMNAFICLTPRPGPTHLHACMCRNFAYVAATVPCLGTQATSCRHKTRCLPWDGKQ
jgi:hypothetical protein